MSSPGVEKLDEMAIQKMLNRGPKAVSLCRCPFCNAHDLVVDCNACVWWVRCVDCGACGPHSIKQGDAIRLWNGTCGEAGHTSLVTAFSEENFTADRSNRNQRKVIDL